MDSKGSQSTAPSTGGSESWREVLSRVCDNSGMIITGSPILFDLDGSGNTFWSPPSRICALLHFIAPRNVWGVGADNPKLPRVHEDIEAAIEQAVIKAIEAMPADQQQRVRDCVQAAHDKIAARETSIAVNNAQYHKAQQEAADAQAEQHKRNHRPCDFVLERGPRAGSACGAEVNISKLPHGRQPRCARHR